MPDKDLPELNIPRRDKKPQKERKGFLPWLFGGTRTGAGVITSVTGAGGAGGSVLTGGAVGAAASGAAGAGAGLAGAGGAAAEGIGAAAAAESVGAAEIASGSAGWWGGIFGSGVAGASTPGVVAGSAAAAAGGTAGAGAATGFGTALRFLLTGRHGQMVMVAGLTVVAGLVGWFMNSKNSGVTLDGPVASAVSNLKNEPYSPLVLRDKPNESTLQLSADINRGKLIDTGDVDNSAKESATEPSSSQVQSDLPSPSPVNPEDSSQDRRSTPAKNTSSTDIPALVGDTFGTLSSGVGSGDKSRLGGGGNFGNGARFKSGGGLNGVMASFSKPDFNNVGNMNSLRGSTAGTFSTSRAYLAPCDGTNSRACAQAKAVGNLLVNKKGASSADVMKGSADMAWEGQAPGSRGHAMVASARGNAAYGSGGGSGVGNADGGSGPSSIVGGAVGSGIGGSGVDGSVRIYGGGTSKGVATGGTNGVVTTPSLDNISTVVTPPIRNVTPDASQKDNTPWGNDTDNANKQLAMAAVMIVTAAGLAVMSRLPGMGFLMGIAVAMAMAAAAMGASVSGTGSNLKNQYGQKAVGSSYEAAGAMTTAGAMGAMSGQSTQLMSSVMAMASPVIATIGTLTQASDSTGTVGQAATPPASSFALDVDTGTTGAVIGGLTR